MKSICIYCNNPKKLKRVFKRTKKEKDNRINDNKEGFFFLFLLLLLSSSSSSLS